MTRYEEQLATLAAAGFTANDIDLIVRRRAARRLEEKTAELASVQAVMALTSSAQAGLVADDALTATDLVGAQRTLAALSAKLRSEIEHLDIDEIRRVAVSGMARREAEGKHRWNVDLVALAREAQP